MSDLVALPIVAALSLGVHLLVWMSLGLLAAGNGGLRAYRRFVAAVALWLALVLLGAVDVAPQLTLLLAGAIAHALPILLLVAGGLPLKAFPPHVSWAIVGVALLLLPFTVTASPLHAPAVETIYFTMAWGAVGVRVLQAFRRSASEDQQTRRRAVAIALVAGPIVVGLLIAFGAMIAIPILVALIQVVVLYAAVRLSIYQVRADAMRTSALATDAAELDRRAIAGEIAAMVAHEVRNPLTGVRSLAQRLSDDHLDEDRRRRYAAIIVREVDRVERLMSALLGATGRRTEPEQIAHTALAELFTDLELLVSAKFRRAGVALDAELPSFSVAAPREPLAQVLLNILLNAGNQAPARSSVRLRARAKDGGLAEILVEDSGPGIPVEQHGSVFEPFHSRTGGSGLGLAVVRRICEERGWTIHLQDTAGGGATFVVSLPLASSGDPLAPARTGAAPRAAVELHRT